MRERMTGAKTIREKPGFQIPGSVPKHLWLSLHGRFLPNSPGGCFWKGLACDVLLDSGASCMFHYGNHMCAAFSVSLPGYLPFAFQRAFHHPHIKGVGLRSRRVMRIPLLLRKKYAKAVGLI